MENVLTRAKLPPPTFSPLRYAAQLLRCSSSIWFFFFSSSGALLSISSRASVVSKSKSAKIFNTSILSSRANEVQPSASKRSANRLSFCDKRILASFDNDFDFNISFVNIVPFLAASPSCEPSATRVNEVGVIISQLVFEVSIAFFFATQIGQNHVSGSFSFSSTGGLRQLL